MSKSLSKYLCLPLLYASLSRAAMASTQIMEKGHVFNGYSIAVAIFLGMLVLVLLFVQRKRIRNFEQKVVASHDILEVALKRTKREVERVRQACELVSLIYFEYDVENERFTGDSRFFRFFFGRVTASMVLEEIIQPLHPGDTDMMECFRSIATGGSSEDIIDRTGSIHNVSGELRYVHVYAKAIYDDDGELIFRRGSMLDITEQKKREIELIRINRHLEFVQHTAKIYSWEMNLSAPDYIRISQDFYKILGETYDSTNKVPVAALRGILSDDDYNALVSGISNGFILEKTIDMIVPLYPKSDAEVMYVHVVSFLSSDNIFAEKGVVSGVIQDVTDLKNAERKAGHAEKIKALGRLASGVAHDFNNQLSGIMGFAELIRTEDVSDTVMEYTNMIVDRGEKSAELIRKLLDFSRSQKEEAELIDVDDIVEDTIRFFTHLVSKSISIKKLIRVRGLGVFGNYNEMQNALLNLGLNARDAIGDNSGKISFEVSTRMFSHDEARNLQLNSGKYVVIKVSDSGHGMTQEVIDKVLEPFFTTKPEGKGTGLGLASVHSAITAMAGGMEIKSVIDEGTEVNLYLPLASDNVSFTKKKDGRENKISHGAGRVLIIDDDKSLVKLLTMQLQKAGYEVWGINDPLEAVRQYADEYTSYDLVILDMIMPNMNGAQVFKELLAVNDRVRVIMMSGYSDDELFEQAKNEGIKHFLTKPVTMTALTKKVAEVLQDIEQESENEI